MSNHVYHSEYFDYIDAGSARSAKAVIPLVQEIAEIKSIVDIGCGRGTWLKQWQNCGIHDFKGVDGDYIVPTDLPFDPAHFHCHDLSLPLDLQRRFDLAQCLEVAEHLPKESSRIFVESLTKHSDLVLFSAATPGQGGEYHINEQPLEFWVDLFYGVGYLPVDALRTHLYRRRDVEPWYRYNMLLFAKSDHPIAELSAKFDWRALRAPFMWRVRNRVLRHFSTNFVTKLARIKRSLARNRRKSASLPKLIRTE